MKIRESIGRLARMMAVLAFFACVLLAAGCGDSSSSGNASSNTSASSAVQTEAKTGKQEKTSYTMEDVKQLKNTTNFAKGALEHIFDGTINKKGKATGYHYSMIEGSKGKILDGSRSKTDKNGIFTAKVEVSGVAKKGFSSFYPETWSPQETVDAINTAYKEAVDDPNNPHGELWVGHAGEIEIDMYLNENKKIVTAYPIFVGKNR